MSAVSEPAGRLRRTDAPHADDSPAETSGSAELRSRPLVVSNEHLRLYVGTTSGRRGTFTLQTSDGEDLLFEDGQPGTSFLTVQVDGKNYVVGELAGSAPRMNEYLSRGPTIVDGSAVITEWQLPEGIHVRQRCRLAGEAVEFEVGVVNEGDRDHDVRIRYLFDYQVGPQDGAPIFVRGRVRTTEARFDTPTFRTWKTYDKIPEPSLLGQGTIGTQPDSITFAHWEYASSSAYEYDEFDSTRKFYREGFTENPESDSSGLLFWDHGTVEAGDSKTVSTFYGLGDPSYEGIKSVKKVVNDYREAVANYFDAFVRTKARANAAVYHAHGSDYADPLVNYYGYVGNVEDVDRDSVPADVRRHLDRLIGDIDEETAANLHAFYKEMFDAVDPSRSVQQLTGTFEQFFLGTHPDQNHYFRIDGTPLGKFISTVQSRIERRTKAFVSKLRQSETSPEPGTVDNVVGTYREQIERLADRREELTRNSRTIEAAIGQNANLSAQFSAAELGGAATGLMMVTIATPIPLVDEGLAATGIILAGGAVVAAGAVNSLWSASTAGKLWATMLRYEAMHSWYYRKKVVQNAQDLKDVAEKSAKLGWKLGTLAGKRIEVTDLSAGSITADDVPDESGARVAKKQGSVTVRNPYTDRDISINPRFVRDNCFITQLDSTGSPMKQFGKVVVPPASEMPELGPGEETTIEFTYLVPLELAPGHYELTITAEANRFAVSEDQAFTSFRSRIGAGEKLKSSQVASGRLTEGEGADSTYQPSESARLGTFNLSYGGSDLDLHLYDSQGDHVGVNYQTGAVVNEIEGVTFSGPDHGTSAHEWMRVSNFGDRGSLRAQVTALETAPSGSPFAVTALEVPELPPVLQVYPNPLWMSGEPEASVEQTVTVAEVAGQSAASDLSLSPTEMTHTKEDHTIEADAFETDDGGQLEAGGTTSGTVTLEIPSDVRNGIYTGKVVAEDADREVSSTLKLRIRGSTVGPTPSLSPLQLAAVVGSGVGTLGYGAYRLLKYRRSGPDVPDMASGTVGGRSSSGGGSTPESSPGNDAEAFRGSGSADGTPYEPDRQSGGPDRRGEEQSPDGAESGSSPDRSGADQPGPDSSTNRPPGGVEPASGPDQSGADSSQGRPPGSVDPDSKPSQSGSERSESDQAEPNRPGPDSAPSQPPGSVEPSSEPDRSGSDSSPSQSPGSDSGPDESGGARPSGPAGDSSPPDDQGGEAPAESEQGEPAMQFCPQCGSGIEPGWRFCKQCGSDLTSDED